MRHLDPSSNKIRVATTSPDKGTLKHKLDNYTNNLTHGILSVWTKLAIQPKKQVANTQSNPILGKD